MLTKGDTASDADRETYASFTKMSTLDVDGEEMPE